MIKYKINLGSDHLNREARQQRDRAYSPQLSGMRCDSCRGVDTVIVFYQMLAPFNIVNAKIQACCSTFEKRIRAKIGKMAD